MSLNIKAIAIDIDGTLVAPEQDVTPRVRRAVKRARERGVMVMLATGRRYDSALPFAEALELDGPLIVSGGAIVCHASSGEIFYEDALPPESVAASVELIERSGLQPVLREQWTRGHRVYTGPEERDTDAMRQYIALPGNTPVRLSYTELAQVQGVMFAAALSHDEPFLQRLARQAWDIPNLLPLVLPPGPGGVLPSAVLDIFNAGTNKAKALHFVSRQCGFDMAEAMAIGDGINDLDLLEAVGMPVAVANAIPEAKALAKVVVSSNDEDGVAEAIERFVLS